MEKMKMSEFENLGLHPQFVQVVEQMGFEQPTPIQQAAIPALLAGRNVMGQAQTGTGKTAAFTLPMLQQIQPGTGTVQALVLAPTRELALQVSKAAGQMAGFMSAGPRARILAVYGGQSYTIQTRQLERGVEVIVGTPGRLLDLMRQNRLDLSQVRYLVLDEADEMLEMGFIEDVEKILSETPAGRQMALFSATLPDAVRKLADRYMEEPQMIAINPRQRTVAETEQRFYRLREPEKLEALTRLLEVEEVNSALVFTRTRLRAQEIADELARLGCPAEALHGDLNQSRREFVLNRFRSRAIQLLVATDVAARGLDIENVSHVFNFDAPADAEDYIHRIGRTGRAGRKGVAITFVLPRERRRWNDIQAQTRQVIQECQVPGRNEILAQRDNRFLGRLTAQLMEDVGLEGGREGENLARQQALIDRLTETGFDLIDIAVAAIRLARAEETPLPEQETFTPVREKRERSSDRSSDRANDRSGDHSSNRFAELPARRFEPASESASGKKEAGDSPRGLKKKGLSQYASEPSAQPSTIQRPANKNPEEQKQADQRPGLYKPVNGKRSKVNTPAGPHRNKRRREPGMVRLWMNLGGAHGLRPSDVVGAIASEAGVPGQAIGEISIHQDHTFVDISEKHVRRVLRSGGGKYSLRGKPVLLKVAN
jgi:ATP-dependent RNA helicase DeaD